MYVGVSVLEVMRGVVQSLKAGQLINLLEIERKKKKGNIWD